MLQYRLDRLCELKISNTNYVLNFDAKKGDLHGSPFSFRVLAGL